ncbi:MAG: AmmeMemoRadiSam system protein B, partial [Acidiferrobacterales bacterium]
MSTDRSPAAAGTFYPSDPVALRNMVREMLADSVKSNNLTNKAPTNNPCALIVPHAGFVYSGPVAARAYTCIQQFANEINRVVLLGPAHRVAVRGMALSSADNFQTPLGFIPLDKAANTELALLPQVAVNDDAHALEHSLEVQLPFLQEVLDEFKLVPIVVGDASPEEVY